MIGQAEHLPLDRMPERFKACGLLKVRGRQRTGSTYALAAVHDHSLLEPVAGTLRAALDDLAAIAPDCLRTVTRPVWCGPYGRRIEEHHLPRGQDRRAALALEIGTDGLLLLDALDEPAAPAVAHELPMVQTLRDVWRMRYAREGSKLRWHSIEDLPPMAERMQSLYGPQAHFSMKQHLSWTGYKVHVTEACDNDATHLITHVKTWLSMQPDMTSTADIHENLAARWLLPGECAEHDVSYVPWRRQTER